MKRLEATNTEAVEGTESILKKRSIRLRPGVFNITLERRGQQ
ncbi:hypothetical protein [Paenibacillus illinoisensis]